MDNGFGLWILTIKSFSKKKKKCLLLVHQCCPLQNESDVEMMELETF